LGSTVASGSTIKLQKDAADTLSYTIDFIDLETVPAAITQPGGSYSVTSYGAVGNDVADDTAAIQTCINAAAGVGAVVWIPSGTYRITSALTVPAVSIQGAGMWYSTIHQVNDVNVLYTNLTNAAMFISDLSLRGEVVNRDNAVNDNGIGNHGGTGSTVQNVWIEHTKCGWWVGGAGSVTNNLTIKNCRIRDTYADGVNFCNGTSNSTITQCHFRNTGDDAMASWSPQGGGTNNNNKFSFNTVQMPWRANCAALYGGTNTKIEDNLFYDTNNYPGINVAQDFTSNAVGGTTSVQRNTLTRCGGPYGGTNYGALMLNSLQGPLPGVLVQDMNINDSTYAGLYFTGNNAITATLTNINIAITGTYGIQTLAGSSGTETCTNVVVTGATSGGLSNAGGEVFNKVSGNSGW
jgi:hypothetical protein